MTKLDFIHIGLGKCMSTRLQTLWGLDENCNTYSGRDIALAVDRVIEEAVEKSQDISVELAKVNLNFPPVDASRTNILTAEDLTFSYLLKPELGEAIAKKDEKVSELLAGMTDKILIMVRNPMDWIRSCHAQHVKEGGDARLDRFLDSHRQVILNNLNLERRVKLWSRFGAEVIILPVELVRQNEEAFWTAYEERLKVKRPPAWQDDHDAVDTNTTGYKTIEPHRRLNEALLLLEASLARSELDPKGEMRKLMQAVRRRCIRRALSCSDTQTIDAASSALGIPRQTSENTTLSLDGEFLSQIEKIYLAPLRADRHFADYGCLGAYFEKLPIAA